MLPHTEGDFFMRFVLTALVLGIGLAVATPEAALSAQNNARSARAAAQAECGKLASAKHFGRRAIQRRNFLRQCMIDHGFNR
jgi:hypothetical protein